MGCYLHSNRERLDEVRAALKNPADLQYCPVCGTPMYLINAIDYMKYLLEATCSDAQETCTDEEGNVLIVERTPWESKDGKPAPKPMDMTFDLDKINIDREVCMLEEASGEKPWMTKYARQRMREQIIEYMNEKQERDLR